MKLYKNDTWLTVHMSAKQNINKVLDSGHVIWIVIKGYLLLQTSQQTI